MAEYGWGLSEELIRKARQELNEFPESRQAAVHAVQELIKTRPDISKPHLI